MEPTRLEPRVDVLFTVGQTAQVYVTDTEHPVNIEYQLDAEVGWSIYDEDWAAEHSTPWRRLICEEEPPLNIRQAAVDGVRAAISAIGSLYATAAGDPEVLTPQRERILDNGLCGEPHPLGKGVCSKRQGHYGDHLTAKGKLWERS